jgi:hypothetical protein
METTMEPKKTIFFAVNGKKTPFSEEEIQRLLDYASQLVSGRKVLKHKEKETENIRKKMKSLIADDGEIDPQEVLELLGLPDDDDTLDKMVNVFERFADHMSMSSEERKNKKLSKEYEKSQVKAEEEKKLQEEEEMKMEVAKEIEQLEKDLDGMLASQGLEAFTALKKECMDVMAMDYSADQEVDMTLEQVIDLAKSNIKSSLDSAIKMVVKEHGVDVLKEMLSSEVLTELKSCFSDKKMVESKDEEKPVEKIEAVVVKKPQVDPTSRLKPLSKLSF